VLDGIDLDVRAGTVFSLLGPNGAGKTTTVNVLTTLIKADTGTVRVAGHDIATEAEAVRAVIGVTGQFAAVDDLLTGEENLQLMADLHHLRSAEGKRVVTSLLERFDLAESAQKMAATYSGGMRRKLDLAMTLVTRPQIIFLDEPTTGLDPRSRRTMWDIVRELVADGVTVSSPPRTLRKPIGSPAGSRCSTRAAWWPRALPTNSSARYPAATSGSGSPTSANSTRRRGS
jgi:ABC-2 type transport system ATP-binding protein